MGELLVQGPAGEWVAHRYADVYALERTSGEDRLAVAPATGHIELMLELAATWQARDHYLLYVLLVSRCGHEEARYASPEPCGFAEMASFAALYRAYLESDGRHHLWLAAPAVGGTLVYDRHNLIYAYGPLARYREVLARRGLVEGRVQIPAPHAHHYDEDNDVWERRLLGHWEWLRSELRPEDG